MKWRNFTGSSKRQGKRSGKTGPALTGRNYDDRHYDTDSVFSYGGSYGAETVWRETSSIYTLQFMAACGITAFFAGECVSQSGQHTRRGGTGGQVVFGTGG